MTDQQTERRLVDALTAAFEKHDPEEWGAGPLSDFIEEYLAALPQTATEPALDGPAVVRAITAASPLINPRLSEIDWDDVAARLAAQPSAEVERLRAVETAARQYRVVMRLGHDGMTAHDHGACIHEATRELDAALAESDHD